MLGITHKVRIRLGRIDVIRKDADGWISAVSLSPFKIRYSSWSLRHGRGFTALVRENYRERGISFKVYLKLLNAFIRRRFSELFFYALLVSNGV
jgi:hypothetical protein